MGETGAAAQTVGNGSSVPAVVKKLLFGAGNMGTWVATLDTYAYGIVEITSIQQPDLGETWLAFLVAENQATYYPNHAVKSMTIRYNKGE